MKSAGIGINLTAATNVLFVDYSWCPSDHMQAIDRIHRIGSTAEHVTIYQLYSKKTVDEYMYKLLEKKQLLFDQLIDGKEVPQGMGGNYTSDIIRSIERRNKANINKKNQEV
jgi:SNF2 family DNA or RNA helicase